MADKTGIEWTDATWNPTTGCDRTSPGCDHCYALTMAGRLKLMGSAGYQNDGDPKTSGPGFALTLHPDRLDQPLRWTRPRKIFVNSMSDLFHVDVPDEFIGQVFDVMGEASQHTFQVLTKRAKAMAQWSWRYYDCDHGGDPTGSCPYCVPYPNVLLGVSIENDRYTFRANHLREAKAALRFLSCEPLLGPLPSLDLTDIDWVIVGGESGRGARPMHPDWVRDIRDRCVAAGVPFLFKQWGEWAPRGPLVDGQPLPVDNPNTMIFNVAGNMRGVAAGSLTNHLCEFGAGGCEVLERVGKHRAGRELEGRTWDEYPS